MARTQYAGSGNVDIAYQVIGEGSHDIVLAFDWASHLETMMESPLREEFVLALARIGRVLVFDMRGIGMSSPVAGGIAPMETWGEDLVAVMEAVGSPRATVVAQGHAAQMAMLAAAAHPDRVSSLVLINGFARLARAEDYPAGVPAGAQGQILDGIEASWGTGELAYGVFPSAAQSPGFVEWYARLERFGATPRVARARLASLFELDVRPVLSSVGVPTLVVVSRGDTYVRSDHGRYLAEHIAGARLLELDTADHFPPPNVELFAAIEEQVTGSRSGDAGADRVLATVLFVDVVDSTTRVSMLGDERWSHLLDRFERTVRDVVTLSGGRIRKTTGDGVLSTFDGPARAVRCAEHLRDDLRRSGLDVRCGLHTGEITQRGDDVSGIAVHIGARVSEAAAPGEVLVTRTVRDLIAGSGIGFEERGERELKGVPERWLLYAAFG